MQKVNTKGNKVRFKADLEEIAEFGKVRYYQSGLTQRL